MITLQGVKYDMVNPVLRATRPITDDELLKLVQKVFEVVNEFFHVHPRTWTNYAAFVGYHFGCACLTHDLTNEQYDKGTALVCQELENEMNREWIALIEVESQARRVAIPVQRTISEAEGEEPVYSQYDSILKIVRKE